MSGYSHLSLGQFAALSAQQYRTLAVEQPSTTNCLDYTHLSLYDLDGLTVEQFEALPIQCPSGFYLVTASAYVAGVERAAGYAAGS